jgi:hypothetical protein
MMTLATEFLPPCPAPGDGVHSWILAAAWAGRKNGFSADSTIIAIRAAISRPPRFREVEEAVRKVFNTEPQTTFCAPIKANFDPAALDQLAEKLPEFTEEDLTARSPVRPESCTSATFLKHLFQAGEKVAVFTRMTAQPELLWECPEYHRSFDAEELECVADPVAGAGVWFLANPVSGNVQAVPRLASERNPHGLTLRAEENATTFRYLVLESDNTLVGQWIKALAQIPLPLSSIVTSGGRSIHALVRIDASDADEWKTIKARIAPALVTLGADPSAMTTVRLTRLPFCFRRENNEWQRLLFLNPAPTSNPICHMPVRSADYFSTI